MSLKELIDEKYPDEDTETPTATIIVKGESTEVPANISVAELFEREGIDPSRFAVINLLTAEILSADDKLVQGAEYGVIPIRKDGC